MVQQLFYLRARGLTAWLEGDRLMVGPRMTLERYDRVPANAETGYRPLGAEIRAIVREHRDAIVQALADPDAEERFWRERSEEYGRLAAVADTGSEAA